MGEKCMFENHHDLSNKEAVIIYQLGGLEYSSFYPEIFHDPPNLRHFEIVTPSPVADIKL